MKCRTLEIQKVEISRLKCRFFFN